MSSSNETSSADLRWVLAILIGIGLVIVGFYFFNFNSHILKTKVGGKFFKTCPQILEIGGHSAIMLAEYLILLLPHLRFI